MYQHVNIFLPKSGVYQKPSHTKLLYVHCVMADERATLYMYKVIQLLFNVNMQSTFNKTKCEKFCARSWHCLFDLIHDLKQSGHG